MACNVRLCNFWHVRYLSPLQRKRVATLVGRDCFPPTAPWPVVFREDDTADGNIIPALWVCSYWL